MACGQLYVAPSPLSDRWGRRIVLTVAVAISALALIGQGLSTSLAMLLLFTALNGASSGVFAISQAMVADAVEDRNQRTIGFGAIGAALGLGFIIGAMHGPNFGGRSVGQLPGFRKKHLEIVKFQYFS